MRETFVYRLFTGDERKRKAKVFASLLADNGFIFQKDTDAVAHVFEAFCDQGPLVNPINNWESVVARWGSFMKDCTDFGAAVEVCKACKRLEEIGILSWMPPEDDSIFKRVYLSGGSELILLGA